MTATATAAGTRSKVTDRLRQLPQPVAITALLLIPLAVAQAVSHQPFFAPPLAATAALVAATPAAPAARWSTVVIGHVVSVAAGLVMAVLLGNGTTAALIAAIVAVAVMGGLGRLHAPAVASAAVMGAVGSWHGAAALLAGTVALVIIQQGLVIAQQARTASTVTIQA
ncbi:MAG: hypothetical protein JWN03_6549 [Nocardia sp.]|uniref:HPP family protein n=1 Tax=Nocardia sp. TaxID=1821 RepID=UPI00260CEBA7|nr:HPP family protein [Nocardia sp.]MCU1646274.1 hypothetical protein [Nocardia sp.]